MITLPEILPSLACALCCIKCAATCYNRFILPVIHGHVCIRISEVNCDLGDEYRTWACVSAASIECFAVRHSVRSVWLSHSRARPSFPPRKLFLLLPPRVVSLAYPKTKMPAKREGRESKQEESKTLHPLGVVYMREDYVMCRRQTGGSGSNPREHGNGRELR